MSTFKTIIITSVLSGFFAYAAIDYKIGQKLDRINNVADGMSETISELKKNSYTNAAKDYQINNLASIIGGKDCSPLKIEWDLKKGTLNGISINGDISNFEKLPCITETDKAYIKNKKLLGKLNDFSLVVTPPVRDRFANYPWFSISSTSSVTGKTKRIFSISGENSGGIQNMGYEWAYPISSYDKIFGPVAFESKTRTKTKGERYGLIYHTRMYDEKYGCLIVQFGGAEDFDKQRARSIKMLNRKCDDSKKDYLDTPSIHLEDEAVYQLGKINRMD